MLCPCGSFCSWNKQDRWFFRFIVAWNPMPISAVAAFALVNFGNNLAAVETNEWMGQSRCRWRDSAQFYIENRFSAEFEFLREASGLEEIRAFYFHGGEYKAIPTSFNMHLFGKQGGAAMAAKIRAIFSNFMMTRGAIHDYVLLLFVRRFFVNRFKGAET